MATLSDEQKQLVKDAFGFVATVDENGNPQIGPKGTLRVLDDEHLIYNEETGHQSWHNVQVNPKIAAAFHPFPGMKGFRVEGRAKIHQNDDIFKQAQDWAAAKKLPKALAAVVISVDRTVSLDAGKNAGIEIENKPVKD